MQNFLHVAYFRSYLTNSNNLIAAFVYRNGWARIVVFFLFVTMHFQSFGQQEFIDSLKRIIPIEKDDSTKIRLYVQLGNRVRLTDTTESWHCQREISKITEATENEFFRGQAYFLAATIQLANDPVKAIDNYERATKIFLKYPNNRKVSISLGSVYINLGLLHNNNNDYKTAIDYYLKAEEVYLKTDSHSSDLSILYTNLSISYGTINKYDEGLVYSKKAYDLARNGKDKQNLMISLYAYGGNLVNAKKNEDLGLAFLDSAKVLAMKFNNLFYVYSCDLMKGMYYYNTKQYPKAIENYTHCLNFAIKYNSTPDIGNSYLNISACEAEMKKTKLAGAHLDSAAKYLDLSIMSVSKQMYFENYAEVYKQLGNFSKAFAYKDSVGVIKDSLYQADNIKQIEFRRSRYNYEKRQNEISQLELENRAQQAVIQKKNIFTYFLIGGAATMLIVLVLSYRNYSQNKKLQQQRIDKLETEKQLTATEAVLKGEEQERTRLAKDLHDGLGGMLSGIKYSFNTMKENLIMTPENQQAFERSMDMLDSSIKEMRRVAHNMMPEALVKFGLDAALKDFCIDINQSGALKVIYQSIGLNENQMEQTTSITIYRIVQELINNIMKHAAATTAIVQVTKSNELVSVTVEDDGKGFDTSILSKTKGMGWTNIQNRVDFLKGKLDVHTSAGKGTSVLIEFNI